MLFVRKYKRGPDRVVRVVFVSLARTERATVARFLRSKLITRSVRILYYFFFPLVSFCFLDAAVSQRHAPPTLWSSDRRVVVDRYN